MVSYIFHWLHARSFTNALGIWSQPTWQQTWGSSQVRPRRRNQQSSPCLQAMLMKRLQRYQNVDRRMTTVWSFGSICHVAELFQFTNTNGVWHRYQTSWQSIVEMDWRFWFIQTEVRLLRGLISQKCVVMGSIRNKNNKTLAVEFPRKSCHQLNSC